ncbi:peptidoglycan editing factor PgeF [Ktedonospora formicarum]|uniref:Purine nucleoside phosphorylase n=1 Tax=Ktedonospora formicarum TaxID=2778364 RepID=A0A8J3HVU2_9CHLR|nr:peptidoglycan editing factor PgeF [Ktedonospora formicarum]GHO44699.1 laccase domain protein [Ktedonospora formicarum]
MIEQQFGNLRYLQFNLFTPYPTLTHGVFTRAGGVSEPPFTGLNTSTPVLNSIRDSVESVIQNRQLVIQAMNMEGSPCVTLWQVHGADVQTFTYDTPWRTDWSKRSYYQPGWTPETIRKGDGLISREREVGLAMSFADCTPLVFYDPVQQAIAIAHGGWRGTARAIGPATIDAMRERFGSQPEQILAGIGPTIGACCYEVSEEVRSLFLGREQFPDAPVALRYRQLVSDSATFSTIEVEGQTSLRLDLQETHRRQLLMAGLTEEHIETSDLCTSCHVDRFFSHRKEQGRTGRFAVFISLKGNHQEQETTN